MYLHSKKTKMQVAKSVVLDLQYLSVADLWKVEHKKRW